MPGRKSYGPGGKWIHDRAHGLMDERKKGSLTERYGDKKGKSIAYAIATQQAHKVGKSPKGFRTTEGVREAKQKFDKPKKEYQKTAARTGRLLRMTDSIVRKGGDKAPGKLIDAAKRLGKAVEQSNVRRGLDTAEQATKHMTDKQRNNIFMKAIENMGKTGSISLSSFFDELQQIQ
jgi:hypothetical protein